MSRHINDYDENTIMQVVSAYLIEGFSHREIQKKILDLPAPTNGGGYIAMDILHYFGIKGEHKGLLKNLDKFNLINVNDRNVKDIIEKVLEVENVKKNAILSIENRTFRVNESTTSIKRETNVRINQNVLRDRVLDNYNYKCALCEINKVDLLICSHIKPWAIDENNRLNPQNAICLCVLHDKLFDKGYFAIDKSYSLVLSKKCDDVLISHLLGCKFRKPNKEKPDIDFLEFHFKNIFDA